MYIAVDIGGTKTLIAAFNKNGRVIKKYKFLTPKKQTEFIAVLSSALVPFSLAYREKTEHVVVAVPGWIENNVATRFGNRPWKNLDLAKCIKKLFNCPIHLENDANLASIYESSFHSGLSLYLTFSTGIGGGLARKSVLAKNSSSLEPGHDLYIWQNQSREWEDITSCAAIGQDYHCRATSIRGKDAYADIAHRISIGLPTLITKYRPDYIIIGGPLALLFPRFKDTLRKRVRSIMPKRTNFPRIVAAKRPQESVIYGAFLYAKRHDQHIKKLQKQIKKEIKSN